MTDWINTADALPTRGRLVTWISPRGDQVDGSYQGMWMLPEGVYVYYTPTFWRYREARP